MLIKKIASQRPEAPITDSFTIAYFNVNDERGRRDEFCSFTAEMDQVPRVMGDAESQVCKQTPKEILGTRLLASKAGHSTMGNNINNEQTHSRRKLT